jgi:hypothetical protein
MSAPGAYHVPPIVVEQHGGLYEVLQGGAHLVEREVRFEARAQMSPQGAPDPECGLRPVRISPVSVSLFPPLGNPTPQADRGACGHTIPRWPCTGLLMIGESVAGLSRRLRVSFGEESQALEAKTRPITVRFNQSDNNTPRICGRFGWKAWRQGCSRSAYMDNVVTISSTVG